MEDMQQSVFLKMSRAGQYTQRSRALNDPQTHYVKFRQTQIQNQFQLVDFNGTGRLTRTVIIQYLQEKYADLNYGLIDDLLNSMTWIDGQVTKQQFCSKYLTRQKKLYHEIKQYSCLRKRIQVVRSIFEQSKPLKPVCYAVLKITKCYLTVQNQLQQWMNLQMEYQDHDHRLSYIIDQPSFAADSQSFQVLLPAYNDYFFLRSKFYCPKTNTQLGQCYINLPLKDLTRTIKSRIDITKNNQTVGYCQFSVRFQSNPRTVQMQLQEQQRQLPSKIQLAEHKRRQYEYLQFLWGVRHRQPQKIAKIDVKWIVALRLILSILLAVTCIALHVLGRYQPLSFILATLLVKNWKYVILRKQNFLMGWVTIAALVLDFVWLAFAAQTPSQIAFKQSSWAVPLTYVGLVVKIGLLLYLLIKEKAFELGEQQSQSDFVQVPST